MQFVDEIKVWYRSYSGNIMAVLGILSGLNGFFNFASKLIPNSWVFYGIALVCAVAWVARFVKQQGLTDALDRIRLDKAIAEDELAQTDDSHHIPL